MKICVLNTSGNVGKSTITRELLFDRLEKTLIIEVESYNSSSSSFSNINSKKFAGNENFETFYEFLISEENDLIFDIGASEVANFFDNSMEYPSAIDEFDYFLIPTKSDSKIMEDSAKTINFLRTQEISDDKIKVIFNEITKSVTNEFSPLLNFDFDFNEEFFIKKSNMIQDLSLLKETFLTVKNEDLKFYREKMKNSADPVSKKKFLKMDLINRSADKKIKEFDNLFSLIFEVNYQTKFKNSAAKKNIKKQEIVEEIEEDL